MVDSGVAGASKSKNGRPVVMETSSRYSKLFTSLGLGEYGSDTEVPVNVPSATCGDLACRGCSDAADLECLSYWNPVRYW